MNYLRLCFLGFIVFFLGNKTLAQVRVEVTSGTYEPISLAAPIFEGPVGPQISQVIWTNLERSGLFRIISPKAYLQKSSEILQNPNLSEWKLIHAQALLAGCVTSVSPEIQVEFSLFNVLNKERLLNMSFISSPENWRRLAHKISDEVYQRLTGEGPYFDTRIVYVAQHGPRNRRLRRLAIMDQDGANHQYLTDSQSLVLTPRFSPTRNVITYLSFQTRPPCIQLMNLEDGRKEILGRFPGMSYAPRFSPDGQSLVMSLTHKGESSLFSFGLKTRTLTQLTPTTSGSIDTSASYAPKGTHLVFNSDRGGSPQLYILDLKTNHIKRISFGEGSYYTPIWSPRGDLIAFLKSYKGAFHLGVMQPDGSQERTLFQSYLLESPTWSPNGRVLMFSSQTSLQSPSKLYSIDLTGHNLRTIITPQEATHPSWSPVLYESQ